MVGYRLCLFFMQAVPGIREKSIMGRRWRSVSYPTGGAEGKIEGGVAAELAGRLQFDAENGKGSYLKARSSEIYNMLVKRFKLEKPQKRARMVAKTDEPEDDEE